MNTSQNNDDSTQNSIRKIMNEADVDRKSEIQNKIKFGDTFTKIALSVAFWGFWIFWAIVALAGL